MALWAQGRAIVSLRGSQDGPVSSVFAMEPKLPMTDMVDGAERRWGVRACVRACSRFGRDTFSSRESLPKANNISRLEGRWKCG